MRALFFAAALLAAPALGHHGWSSFDEDRPYYLRGTIKSVRWANPHAEAVIQVAPDLKLPADLASRSLPKQAREVDSAAIVTKVQLPPGAAGEWQLEFAPMTRMQAWGMGDAPKVGDPIEVIGYGGPASGGIRVFRVEYLFLRGRVAGLRSSPTN